MRLKQAMFFKQRNTVADYEKLDAFDSDYNWQLEHGIVALSKVKHRNKEKYQAYNRNSDNVRAHSVDVKTLSRLSPLNQGVSTSIHINIQL